MPNKTYPTDDLASLVNPLQGTDSQLTFSNGNTLPLVAMPWGMTHWTAQTNDSRWFFSPHDRKLESIRATHQPSPWIGDYGHISLLPVVGPIAELSPGGRASSFRPDQRAVRPDYMRYQLLRYRTSVELTPTERCAAMRVQWPAVDDARFLVQPYQGPGEVHVDLEQGRIWGKTRGIPDVRADGGGAPDNFVMWFVLDFDAPLTGGGLIRDEQFAAGELEGSGDRIGAYAQFAADGQTPVTVRIATSFISREQAEQNLAAEIGDRSFDDVRAAAAARWNDVLGRFQIGGATEPQARTFYTCLYRSLLFPRFFHEFDADGTARHFSPYDGLVHEGVLCADNGFWDTYRTVYPLLAIAYPDVLGDIVQGWINCAKEGGHFPKWASPGYRACMIGTHIDAVIADAVVKGIDGFDIETAYKYCRLNSTEPGPAHRFWGRLGLEHYIEKGFVPSDLVEHGTGRTMEFAYNDFCVSVLASELGEDADAQLFAERSLNYRNVIDKDSGFARGRNADGSWFEPFSLISWGGPYVEAAAWQYTWTAPHDPEGLFTLLGGKDAALARLDELMKTPPDFEVGEYGWEMHEMSEMAAVDFGQYAHCNQPSHHILYLFAAAGRPSSTHYWVRKVCDELYTDQPDGLPGDEDNGEMCAWYLLSAMGVFPLCPGKAEYVLGSPLFEKLTITRPGLGDLVISAPSNADDRPYVHQVTVNGAEHEDVYLPHEAIATGGEIVFEMSDVPG